MHESVDLRRLEELGLNSSAPPGQLLYDGWLLRLLPGKAKRARSVNAVYPSTLPLAQKIPYCERLYAAQGLPPIFRITPFSQPSTLDAELERLGYPRFDLTAVEAMRLAAPVDGGHGCEVLPLADWVDAVGELRGSDARARRSHLIRLQGTPLPLQPLALRLGGRVVATGLTIVEDGWAGLFDIVTDATQRRQGFGDRIVRGLLDAARAHGATGAYLQVSADNLPARRIYHRHGFREHYLYWYRGQPE